MVYALVLKLFSLQWKLVFYYRLRPGNRLFKNVIFSSCVVSHLLRIVSVFILRSHANICVCVCLTQVLMGSLSFDLGPVQYDNDLHSQVPLAAQIGLAAGAAVVVLIVLVIILMYR